MDLKANLLSVIILFILTVALNIPCGYWRKRHEKYSFSWFFYIHIPIPIIFVARSLFNLDMKYIPIFLIAAVIGQIWGGKMEI